MQFGLMFFLYVDVVDKISPQDEDEEYCKSGHDS